MNCLYCQKHLVRKSDIGRIAKYCSKVCSDKFNGDKRKQRIQALTRRDVNCSNCQTAFVTHSKSQRFCQANCRKMGLAKEARINYIPRMKQTPRTIYCGWCGIPQQVGGSDTRNKLYHDDCRLQAKRARYRIKTVKRQSKLSVSLRVSVEQLAQRDGEYCYLCQEVIDLTLPRTNRFGATIDHVIPISKGGQDIMDNLKLTHWICNNRKSDKLVGQLHG